MSSKGKKCYTNGERNIYLFDYEEIPEGFYKGFSYKSQDTLNARINKTKQTKLERYGSETYTNVEKMRKTCTERYGVDNAAKTKEVQEKMQQTCLDKYGVKNAFQSEYIKDKIKQTCLDRYGVEHISQSDMHRQHLREFWENISEEQYNKISENKRKTTLERYGCTNVWQSLEIKEKIKQTCLDKYGVPYFVMSNDCRKYSSNNSKPNLEFSLLLDYLSIEYDREFVIQNKIYDFKVNNTLIEINPYSTHNSTWGIFNKPPIENDYHFNKTKLAVDNGYRCICIWDWDDIYKVTQLLVERETIYARKCDIREISYSDCCKFLNEHHLQGATKSSIQFALFYNDEIVSVMTFGKPRYNKKYEYELIRFCSSKNVIGGSQKLFKHFINTYKPKSIISYCDLSKFSGNTYYTLGFKYSGYSIGKHWYNPKTHKHITDNLLRQRGFDQLLGKEYGCFGKGTSNDALMLQHNFVEIYDAGQATFTWNN